MNSSAFAHILIQQRTRTRNMPTPQLLRRWAGAVLSHEQVDEAAMAICIVDRGAMAKLNATYRHKKGPTNVLSFPAGLPSLLGDIVICAGVVNQEAKEQGKSNPSHWAHMIVHGVLHLLGYDHEKKREAQKMEKLEIDIMKRLGFENPYAI
jgi:probable rRNA maturation factor